MTTKHLLCIDFDGVIHSYEKGWQKGVIYGTVVPGFFEWAQEANKSFHLIIYSTRAKDPVQAKEMQDWVQQHYEAWSGYDKSQAVNFDYAHQKPAAWLTIDDRAVCFKGDWASQEVSPSALKAFKPWNHAGT